MASMLNAAAELPNRPTILGAGKLNSLLARLCGSSSSNIQKYTYTAFDLSKRLLRNGGALGVSAPSETFHCHRETDVRPSHHTKCTNAGCLAAACFVFLNQLIGHTRSTLSPRSPKRHHLWLPHNKYNLVWCAPSVGVCVFVRTPIERCVSDVIPRTSNVCVSFVHATRGVDSFHARQLRQVHSPNENVWFDGDWPAFHISFVGSLGQSIGFGATSTADLCCVAFEWEGSINAISPLSLGLIVLLTSHQYKLMIDACVFCSRVPIHDAICIFVLLLWRKSAHNSLKS